MIAVFKFVYKICYFLHLQIIARIKVSEEELYEARYEVNKFIYARKK